MNKLSDLTGQTLELIQPAFFKDGLVLMSGDILIGKMSFPKMFFTQADIEFLGKQWQIKRESFWRNTLGIYKNGFEMPSYKFVPLKTTLGEIQFPKGERLFVKQYIFKSTVELQDKRNELLVSIKSKSGFKKKFFIELLKPHKLIDEYPWVILLTGYIIVRKERSKHAGG
jgi:hypothetical protein